MRIVWHPARPRVTELALALVSLSLMLALLVAAYGILVPFFAALAATPLVLALLSLGAVSRAVAEEPPAAG